MKLIEKLIESLDTVAAAAAFVQSIRTEEGRRRH